jgi:nucleoside-diphosphate-sugar epimerase
MRLAIVGCGTFGGVLATEALAAGHAVIGLRRTPEPDPPCPMVHGDGADPAVLAALGAIDGVVLCANPGLRRGRDNGVAAIATALVEAFPAIPLIWTGTTAVYADAGGAAVDESGALLDDPASRGLLAIETAVRRHPRGLVLRAPALVGPARTELRRRLAAAGPRMEVRGDPDRPFSVLHDRDLAEICLRALTDAWPVGLLNVASPETMSLRDYYRLQASAAGVQLPTLVPVGDAPRRRIFAGLLWDRMGRGRFRAPLEP